VLLRINRQLIAQLWEQAASSQTEVCGLLIGGRSSIFTADRIVVARNVHPTPQHHFLIDAPTLLQTDTDARRLGQEIIGFYHSHPNGGAMLSMDDRRDPWPGFVLAIIAVKQGTPVYLCTWVCCVDGTIQPLPLSIDGG
jgi:proteasome lid subunit RPN8/RPN11